MEKQNQYQYINKEVKGWTSLEVIIVLIIIAGVIFNAAILFN